MAYADTMTGSSRRRRSFREQYEAWLAWRKKTVEDNFLDVCTCYIGKPFAKQGSCKNCQMCPGCEQHIKNKYWAAHDESCRALSDLRRAARCQR